MLALGAASSMRSTVRFAKSELPTLFESATFMTDSLTAVRLGKYAFDKLRTHFCAASFCLSAMKSLHATLWFLH